jgi:MoaA/NifB/PqqE/SkfB family radical SAM enzyme
MNIIGYLKLGSTQGLNYLLQSVSYRLNQPICKPGTIILNITHKCPLRCKHCEIWKRQPISSELSLDEKISALSQLKEWLGPFCLSIVGEGEPLASADELCSLIKYAATNQIRTDLTSNAVFITPALAQKIVDSGLNSLAISLDGIVPETHDYIRGVDGTFKRVMQAISFLRAIRKSMLLNINTVIMEQNLDELVDMVQFVKEEGLDGITFSPLQVPFGSRRNVGWLRESELWPKSPVIVRDVMKRLKEMKNSGFPIINDLEHLDMIRNHYQDPERIIRPCHVGFTTFKITLNGDVYFCGSMPTIGNIKEQCPAVIWASPLATRVRNIIRSCEFNCRLLRCNYRRPLFHKASSLIWEIKKSYFTRAEFVRH